MLLKPQKRFKKQAKAAMFIENRIKELSTRTDLILSKKGKRRDLNKTKSGLSKEKGKKETILPERK